MIETLLRHALQKILSCIAGRLGKQALRAANAMALSHKYLLVIHKTNPACCHLSRGRTVHWLPKLTTEPRSMESHQGQARKGQALQGWD